MEKTWTIKNLPAIWETQVQSPGEGNGNPPWYSCLENSMDRGAWRAKVHWVAESDMTVTNTHTHVEKTYLIHLELFQRLRRFCAVNMLR